MPQPLHAWLVCFKVAAHYGLYRLGLVRPPDFFAYPDDWYPWLGSVCRWKRRLRVVGAEHCPAHGPALFAASHAKLDDPLFIWGAVFRASGEGIHIRFMMRDDFFVGFPWDYLPYNVNELTRMAGCIQISRDSIQLSQLRPLINLLRDGLAFVMFPGRTRTRSGMVFEYREGFDEPGGVSFFIVHGQRRAGEGRIPAVPVARTFNPVDKTSAVAFGAPHFLAPDADREAQRAFDFNLAVAIGDLIEVHALHLLSAILYLHVLHGGPPRLARGGVVAAVCGAAAALTAPRLIAPSLRGEAGAAAEAALRFLEKRRLLTQRGTEVLLHAERMLAVPPLDTKYLRANPVKYHVNQIMHLGDVLAAAEAAAGSLR
jgi:hypothetical protein